jgi:hypothetical protein
MISSFRGGAEISREESAYDGEQKRLQGGPGQAAATHPLQEGVVRQLRRLPSPQCVLGADVITTDRARSQNQTGGAGALRSGWIAGVPHECGFIFLHGYRW